MSVCSHEANDNHRIMTQTHIFRNYKNIPVVIVDDHNDVLSAVHRAIASRHLPYSNVAMVHLDAHPDLGVPENLSADTVYDTDTLYEYLDIENWIMPAVYAGHLDRVAWVKPEWSQQMCEGNSNITVGQCRQSGTIRVDCTEDYFLSDGTYAPSDDLLNQKQLHLSVYTLHNNNKHKNGVCAEDLVTYIKSDPFILDIDLDFFSTQNPFLGEYSPKQMDLLKKLFEFSPPKDDAKESLVKCTELRMQQLAELRALFTSFQSGEVTEDDVNDSSRLLKDLVKDIQGEGHSVDYEVLYNAGLTCDSTELPHHVSSMEEIRAAVGVVEYVLRALHKPTLVTVARSGRDDYCPKHQVDAIEEMVVNMLRAVYTNIHIDRQYDRYI